MPNTELVSQTKQAFKRMAKSVYVLSCVDQGKRHASISTAITNVSNDPPSLLICMEKTASFSTLLTLGSCFAVNVLGANQQDIVEHCMQHKGEDRFSIGDWQQSGAENRPKQPVLADAQATFLCCTAEIIGFETHNIVIARIEKTLFSEQASALVYVANQFKSLPAL